MKLTPAEMAQQHGPNDGPSPDYEYVMFVDETGDLGLKREGGSSEWFVMAGVVVSKTLEHSIVDWVRDLRVGIGATKAPELHYRLLSRPRPDPSAPPKGGAG